MAPPQGPGSGTYRRMVFDYFHPASLAALRELKEAQAKCAQGYVTPIIINFDLWMGRERWYNAPARQGRKRVRALHLFRAELPHPNT